LGFAGAECATAATAPTSSVGRDIENTHAQELVTGITILLNGGIIYVKKSKGFPVENPHWMWILGKRHPKYFELWRGFHGSFSGRFGRDF
jgi:hypothetical protein